MSTTQQGLDILRRAETSLRSLLSEAAGTGSYEDVLLLAGWARELAGIIQRAGPRAEGRPAPSPGRSGGGRKRRARRPVGTARRGDYPRFARDGTWLVKTSWSRKARTEYQHRAPRRVVDLLVAALQRAAARAERVTMDSVLPLLDPADGSEVPSYQAYLCLAWLRSTGLIIQHGRKGYSLAEGGNLPRSVEALWHQLSGRETSHHA